MLGWPTLPRGHSQYTWWVEGGPMELHIMNPPKHLSLKLCTPQNTWPQNFLSQKIQDLKTRLQINTLYCLLYQHFFWNSHVAEKKLEWIIFWSTDCNKNFVSPQNIHLYFFKTPKNLWQMSWSQKYRRCKFSAPKNVRPPIMYTASTPLGNTLTTNTCKRHWQDFCS